MTNSKYFAFFTVILIAILIVFGNSISNVKASNVGIVTPTPTGMPSTETGTYETVSIEQQEELKAVIQSYFEIRYQARILVKVE